MSVPDIDGDGPMTADGRPARPTVADRPDEDAIRVLVRRLARPHRPGQRVVERASLLAAGSHFGAVMAWIEAHGGTPEPVAEARSHGGLHGPRPSTGRAGGTRAERFILPDAVLDREPRHHPTQDEELR